MKKRQAGSVCVAKNCRNKTYNCIQSFFTFPKDPTRAQIWFQNCGREDLLKSGSRHHRICGAHFEDVMFLNDLKNRLQPHAVPTLFGDMEDGSVEVSPQLLLTTISNSKASASVSARRPGKVIRREYSQLSKQKEQLKLSYPRLTTLNSVSPEQFISLTYKLCPSRTLAKFITIQIAQVRKYLKRCKHSSEFKKICLTLYFTGPKLYEGFMKGCLPSPTALLKFVTNFKMRPGLNNSVLFDVLKQKVSIFPEDDKLCILCMDEMPVKSSLFYAIDRDAVIGLEDDGQRRTFKPALTSLVFMIRGIRSSWCQPLSYYFFHSTCPAVVLKDIIFETITKLLVEIGLKVMVLISDMKPNNIQLVQQILHVTPRQPYILVNGYKVLYMFDTLHLIKTTRNDLLDFNFVTEAGNVISWQFISDLYNNDQNFPVPVVPKLTKSHISPNNTEKTKIKFAAQVFSHSVYFGLIAYMRFGVMPANAAATAEFVDMMDKLFDILNSSYTASNKEYNRAFQGEEYQINFLKCCLSFFNGLKVVDSSGKDVTNQIKFLSCFKITINAFLQLWDQLDEHCKYIFTRRINLDCLKNFFRTIRQQNSSMVTPIQFQRSFKKHFCQKLFDSGTETYYDTEKMLLELNNVKKFSSPVTPNEADEASKIIISNDYKDFNMSEQNNERSVCRYLIEKCLAIHTCTKCIVDLDKCSDDSTLISNDICYYVAELEKIFLNNFEKMSVQPGLLQALINTSKNIPFSPRCVDFQLDFLTKLYFRLRIFYSLKSANRNFKCTSNIIWKHQ